jgi:hypothetical protein
MKVKSSVEMGGKVRWVFLQFYFGFCVIFVCVSDRGTHMDKEGLEVCWVAGEVEASVGKGKGEGKEEGEEYDRERDSNRFCFFVNSATLHVALHYLRN